MSPAPRMGWKSLSPDARLPSSQSPTMLPSDKRSAEPFGAARQREPNLPSSVGSLPKDVLRSLPGSLPTRTVDCQASVLSALVSGVLVGIPALTGTANEDLAILMSLHRRG